MAIVSLAAALALFSLLLLTSGSAPGDEHDYCVNTFNAENPPSAREDGRNILLDTYNYAALLTGIIDFTNPVVNTYSPVFRSFDVDGSSPPLGWNQFRPVGNCRLQVADCKFDGTMNPPLQDNWLVTQFIRLDSSHKEMRVFVNHSITLCMEGTICRNSYSAYVFPANGGTNITLAAVTNPTVDRLDPPFAEADSDVHSRYVSFSHMADMYDGFYVALRSEDACVYVHRVQVFYWTCPGGLQGLAEVDGTAEPLESRTFRCIGNSTQSTEGDRLICIVDSRGEEEYSEWRLSGSGTALSISEVCQCNPGFQLLMGACSECPEGMFKEGLSNDVCTLCPEYSFTNVTGSASCQCVNGRYRGTMESASLPCALPPSAPNNLTLVGFSGRTVSLSWEPPLFNGSRSTFFYTIWYRRVEDTEWTEGDTVMMNGNDPVVNHTQSGLIPHSQYIVRVTADSMATDTVPEELAYLRSLNITVTTLSDVPGIGSAPILTSPPFADFITITLVPPQFPNGVILQYNIRWYMEGQKDGARVVNVSGTQQSYTLSGLAPGTYLVQVRAVSAQGAGNFSEPIPFVVESFPLAYIGAIVGGAVGLAFLVAIIFVVVCFIRYCCQIRKQYKSTRRLDEEVTEGAELVSFAPNVGVPKKRNYVDPRNYASTDDALVDFAKEIPQHEINMRKIIGSGEFGDVVEGFWYSSRSSKPIKVAVKTLKEGSPNKAREDFLTEATIMGQFDDENVIRLHGVVSKSHPVMIVMEFMENGSLESYLKQNDGLFETNRLVRMAAGVASGMKYLAGIGFVHRDLAARNVLVDSKETCKISDFGLSRETEENAYNVKTGGKIPVRWTPPEAIHYRKFTEKSDVWSFGVLLWEVMSYGAQPYADWGNQQVLREVDKGYRLPCPEATPDSLYQVMLNCWEKESTRRPTFAQNKADLEDLLRNNFVGRSKPPRVRREVKSPLAYNSIQEWLVDLKMEQYTQNFIDLALTLKECCRLTEEDMDTLSITVPGHRHKILASIQCAYENGETTATQ